MSTNSFTEVLKHQALSMLKSQQKEWLAKSGIEQERPDYTFKREGNLFEPLPEESLKDLSRGQGGELSRRNQDRSPPKFHAVHSSSALAATVLGYWRVRDLSVLTRALNSPNEITRMELEAPFKTGFGFPCALDVALWANDDKYVLAVESKFGEPFSSTKKEALKIGYVPLNGDSAWKKRGLDKCDQLAREIQTNRDHFAYLNAPQNLKHILGLHRTMGDQFRLLYLFYDVAGPAGDDHRREAEEFKQAVAGEVDFKWDTYQTFVTRLRDLSNGDPAHSGFFEYLNSRYQLG